MKMDLTILYIIGFTLSCAMDVYSQNERSKLNSEIILPLQTFPEGHFPILNVTSSSEEENDYDMDDEDNSAVKNETPEGRLLSQSAFNRISETLGVLNTVGNLLVDITRGGTDVVESTTTASIQNDVDQTFENKLTKIEQNETISSLAVLENDMIKRIGVEEMAKPTFVEKKKKNKRKKKNPTVKTTTATPSLAAITSSTVIPPITSTTTTTEVPFSSQPESDELSGKEGENRCTTPEGRPGRCEDLSRCPALLLNMNGLRESLCFKSLFVPGVCCPITQSTVLTTTRPLLLTTRPTTTRRPSTPNLILIPQIKPSTTTTRAPTTLAPPISIDSNDIDNVVDMEECGQQEYSSGRIVGGLEAPNGQWPWMAAIFLHGPKRTEFWCGGSLIGDRYILTAAHCTRDSRQKPFAARQFTVRLGDIDLSTDNEPSAPVTFAVKEVRVHERFSRMGFYNDIAILVLDRQVRKSKYVIPLCLPVEKRLPPNERLIGRRATVVGWGTTYYGGKESTSQRQADLPLWRNEDCDKAYFQPINANFLCAGYSDGGVDACQGDSGGPLMMRIESRWVQLGIVSFGNKCGEPGYPGVYTRVSKYLDWIDAHTKY